MERVSGPNIYIPADIKARLDLYIKHADGEVSGLGEVERFGRGLRVTQIHLFKQECSPVHTNMSQEDVANFLLESTRAGLDLSALRLWWHSHDDMSVFWSYQDDETIRAFSNDWMLSIVGNRFGRYLARVDVQEPFHMSVNELHITVEQQVDAEVEKRIATEVKQKVTIAPIQFHPDDKDGIWDLDKGCKLPQQLVLRGGNGRANPYNKK